MGLTRTPPNCRTGILANIKEEIIQTSGHAESSDDEENAGVFNDSFVFAEFFKNTPKAVNLIQVLQTSKGGGVWNGLHIPRGRRSSRYIGYFRSCHGE